MRRLCCNTLSSLRREGFAGKFSIITFRAIRNRTWEFNTHFIATVSAYHDALTYYVATFVITILLKILR